MELSKLFTDKKKLINVCEHLDKITANPMKIQEDLLMKIIQDNKDSEYGKKYGFEKIHTIEEYQKNLPLTNYDDYKDYIRRMSEEGEKNLITSSNISIYLKTSGTVGIPKKIPATKEGIKKYLLYNIEYLKFFKEKYFGNSLDNGRYIFLIQCNEVIENTKDGAMCGSLSETIAVKMKPFWSKLFTSPVEASFAGPGVNIRYLHSRYALSDKNPTKMMCSFANYALDFFNYIEKNWKMLVEDIEKGTINESIQLPDKDRKNLIKNLNPDVNRAKELRNIFEKGFDTPFAPKVWPNLKYISCTTSGTFKVYTKKIQKRYTGNISFYHRGVLASEGLFSVPIEFNNYNSSLIPDSVFYEFLPENKEPISENLVTLDKIEVGKKYELFITNVSGFYRYGIKDVIKVTGFYNKTPTIEFCYRSDKSISLIGEKTSEFAIITAAQNTALKCGFNLVGSTVYPDTNNSRYIFLMEVDSLPKNFDLKKATDVLQNEMREVNPYMDDKIKKGYLSPTILKLLKKGAFNLYKEHLVKKGYAKSQIKPVNVITNEGQRKFFFDLIEKE